jgi:hypothetical protein
MHRAAGCFRLALFVLHTAMLVPINKTMVFTGCRSLCHAAKVAAVEKTDSTPAAGTRHAFLPPGFSEPVPFSRKILKNNRFSKV